MPALRMAAPAVLIVLVVAFGFHGESTLTLRELGGLYVGTSELRTGVLVLWALVMAPAARLALMAEGLTYLRWLPLPRSLILLHFLGLLALLHLVPVIPLFVAGFPAEGIGMWLALTGIATCLLPGTRGFADQLLRLVGAATVVAAVHLGAWTLAMGVGLALATVRVMRAWQIAPEHSHWRSQKRWLFGGTWLSLTSAQLLHVWRSEAAMLSRTLLISALGISLIPLVTKANQGYLSEGSLLVTSTPTIAAVSIMLALALKRARRQLDWVLRSLGVSLTSERTVSLALIVTGGGLVALTMGALVAAPASHIVALLVHTTACALFALGISSRSQEEIRSVSATLAMALFAMFIIGLGGRVMLGAELGIGLLVAGRVLLRDVSDA